MSGGGRGVPHALTQRSVLVTPGTALHDDLCATTRRKVVRSEDSLRKQYQYLPILCAGQSEAPSAVAMANPGICTDGDGMRVARPTGHRHPGRSGPLYRELLDSAPNAEPCSKPCIPRRPVDRAACPFRVPPRAIPCRRRLQTSTGSTTITRQHLLSDQQQGQAVLAHGPYYRPFGGFVDRAHPPQRACRDNVSSHRAARCNRLYDFDARLYDPLNRPFHAGGRR